MPTSLARAGHRRAEALARAIAALEELARRGVDAGVIGSLARDGMAEHSDVDFVVLDRGPLRFNDVLRIVDRMVGPVPWDVVFLDRVEPSVRASFTRELRRVPDLRELEGDGDNAAMTRRLPLALESAHRTAGTGPARLSSR